MATEVEIPGSGERAKIRSPWAPIALPIVTLFVYAFCWYYFVNRELAALGAARGAQDELGDNPGRSLLAVTLGALVLVPAAISLYNTGQRIQAAQRLAGVEPLMSGWLSLVMALLIPLPPVICGYWQSELNKVWRAV